MNTKNRTWVEINKTALLHNIHLLKKSVGSAQLALVLKSNAYGHGIFEIGTLADKADEVSWLCTAGLSEALMLRQRGITKPLIALSYLDDSFEEAVHNTIHCAIYNYEDALNLSSVAVTLQKKAYIHIKIDTGMSRLGILPEDALKFIGAIQALPNLVLYGLFTHLCDTSNQDQSYSYMQLQKFDQLLLQLKELGITIPCIHTQSSSGLCIIPGNPYTLVRAGASVYGIWKSNEHKNLILRNNELRDLKPVLTWKTTISQIKTIPAQTYIGYDRTYKTNQPTTLAIAPIGYWEGYPRTLSNKGIAHIKGQNACVRGIISMNLTAFDITDIPNVKLGDEIILLGDSINAQDGAQQAGVITNEMVTRINPLIPRIIV